MNERLNIVLVFLAAYVVLLFYAVPGGLVSPFPFSDMQIDRQTYVWIGTIYGALAIFATTLWVGASPKAISFFRAAMILQVCLFVEYWLNYNQPWGYIGLIPVHIATLRLPILFYYAIRTFTTWKT